MAAIPGCPRHHEPAESLPPPHSAISILFLGVFVPLADATFPSPSGVVWGLVVAVLVAQLIWPPSPVLASLLAGLFHGLALVSLTAVALLPFGGLLMAHPVRSSREFAASIAVRLRQARGSDGRRADMQFTLRHLLVVTTMIAAWIAFLRLCGATPLSLMLWSILPVAITLAQWTVPEERQLASVYATMSVLVCGLLWSGTPLSDFLQFIVPLVLAAVPGGYCLGQLVAYALRLARLVDAEPALPRHDAGHDTSTAEDVAATPRRI